MAIFCTKCGTSNEAGAGFCDNCGAPLRPTQATTQDVSTMFRKPTVEAHMPAKGQIKKIIYAGIGLAAVLVLGGGAMYFVLRSPAATATTLLAAAKVGYGKETTNRFKDELCLSNTDYSKSTFNADENDQRTQTWMNAMVAAGLYTPPVTISSGGYFARNLLQYVATPELQKYRDGTRLCAAKNVEITDVIDIEKPEKQSIRGDGEPPKVMAVKTKLVFKSVDTAPWMENPAVRDAVMANINGWNYKDKAFQKQVADTFGLREKKWTTGLAYKAELQKQLYLVQRNNKNIGDGSNRDLAKSATSGFNTTLSNLFRTGHPLRGTWRNNNQGEMQMIAEFGAPGPGGIKMTKKMTFTSDSIETDGQSVKCKFETNGKRIKVTPEGQSISLIFNIEDDASMSIDLTGIGTFRYIRTD